MLWMCGMPGLTPGDLIDIDMDAVDGEGVIHLSNADYLTRPLRLSADEALALVLALRTLREIAGPGRRAAIDSRPAQARRGGRERGARRAGQRDRDGRPRRRSRPASTMGCSAGKRLDLTYDVATRAETTRRLVDPLRVFVLEGYGYLEAWCYSAQALRTFRLDRIAAVELTDRDVQPHDVALRDLSGGWFEALQDAPAGHARAEPHRPAWVAEYYPNEGVTYAEDGSSVLTMRVTDPAWLRGLLLRLGGAPGCWRRRGPAPRPRRPPRRRSSSTRRSLTPRG